MNTIYASDIDQYITSDPRLLVPTYGDTQAESEQRAADALAAVSKHKTKNADEPTLPRVRPTLIPTGHLQWWMSPDNGKSQFYGEPRKTEAAKEFRRSLLMGH